MPKISQLDPGSALAGLEMIPDVQSGVTVRTTPSAVATYVLGQLPDLPVEVKDANFEILNSVDTTKVARFSAAAISPATTRSYTLPNANATLVGLDTAQTLKNKTIDNTNSATLLDTQLTIQDNVDPTKQARVNSSGISTATTRTYNLPNANGTLALTSDITQYLPITRQVFASSGTWTRPTGCRAVLVTVIGGGGGGGGVTAQANRAGSGGGSGAAAQADLDVTSIASATITIGAAGAAGIGGVSNPGSGGTSSWADGTNTLTAGGGAGGLNDTSITAGGFLEGGAGGTASGGDLNLPGARGQNAAAATLLLSGSGGSTPLGYGAGGVARSAGGGTAGHAGSGYGAGGSGGMNGSNTSAIDGGAGAPGIVIVEEFY